MTKLPRPVRTTEFAQPQILEILFDGQSFPWINSRGDGLLLLLVITASQQANQQVGSLLKVDVMGMPCKLFDVSPRGQVPSQKKPLTFSKPPDSF